MDGEQHPRQQWLQLPQHQLVLSIGGTGSSSGSSGSHLGISHTAADVLPTQRQLLNCAWERHGHVHSMQHWWMDLRIAAYITVRSRQVPMLHPLLLLHAAVCGA
jgi:hypothetical protein